MSRYITGDRLVRPASQNTFAAPPTEAYVAEAAAWAALAASRAPFISRAEAMATTISVSINRISTYCYDPAIDSERGGGSYRRSSSMEVSGYPARAWFQSADGAYWLLDEAFPNIHMFGAVADMVYSTVTEPDKHPTLGDVGTGVTGLVRSAGTDCREAAVQGDAYAAARNVSLWFDEGNYFIDNSIEELTTTAKWMSIKDFGATIWVEYNKNTAGIHQSGFVIKSDYTGFGIPGNHGFKMIGQFSSDTTKPAGRGHQGTLWRTNEYYFDGVQPIIRGITVRTLMCRASLERDAASNISQLSIGSILCAAMGGVEDFTFELGLFGTTNISSGRVFLAHWGANANLVPYDEALDDMSAAEIHETYHAIGGSVKFITDIDNRDGHDITQTWEVAAAGIMEIGSAISYQVNGGSGALGGGCGGVTCGDLTDIKVCDAQKGRVGRGIKVGFQSAYEVSQISGAECFYVKGSGTDKDIVNGSYPGTNVPRQYQQEGFDVTCAGFYIEAAAGQDPTLGRGIFAEDVTGRINFGTVETYGLHRGIEIENCVGRFEVARHIGDGAFINNFSKEVIVHDCSPDRTNVANAADTNNYAYGYESVNSRAVEIVGREVLLQDGVPANLTVVGAHTAGTELLLLSGPITNNAVAVGDTLRVGTNQVKVRRRASASGAESIEISPLLLPLVGGETVTLIQEAKTRGSFGFSSSSQGIVVGKHGYLLGADISRVQYAGEHAVLAYQNGVVQISGGELPFVGRSSTAITNRRTIRAEDEAHVILRDVLARDNQAVTTHIQLIDDSTALVDGCRIEDRTSLINAVDTVAQVSWGNNFDFLGNKISHPTLDTAWTPVLERSTSGATGITTTTNHARSTVIDSLVRVSFDITVTAYPTPGTTEYMVITGMPIPILVNSFGVLLMDNGTGTMSPPSDALRIVADTASQELRFFRQATSGEATIKENEVGNGNIMRGEIWYRWR